MSGEVLNVQFRGLDEAADPKAQPPGTLVRADNCVMDKARRLSKRRGTTGYSRTATFGFANTNGYAPLTAGRIISRGADLVVNDGRFCFARSSALGKWDVVGEPSVIDMRRRGFVDVTRSAGFVDTVVEGDLLVALYTSGYTSAQGSLLHVRVEDVNTGAVLMQPTFISAFVTACRLIRDVGGAYLVWTDTAGNVKFRRINLNTMVMAAAVTIATDAITSASSPGLDACTNTGATGISVLYVVYKVQVSVGGKFVRTRGWNLGTNAFLANDTIYTNVASAISVAIACSGNDQVAIVASDTSSGTIVATFDEHLNVVHAAGGLATSGFCPAVSVDFYDGTRMLVTRIVGSAAATSHQSFVSDLVNFTTLAQVAANLQKTFHAQSMSRSFQINGRWYAVVTFFPRELSLISSGTLTQASTVVVHIDPDPSGVSNTAIPRYEGAAGTHDHVGTCENQTGWTPVLARFCQQAAVHRDPASGDPDGVIYIASPFRNREPTNLQLIPTGWDLHRISEVGADLHRFSVSGLGGLASAGAPFWFDGIQAKAYGFAHAPLIVSLTDGGAGGTLAAGTYFYMACYEWKDKNGVLHRSPFSPPKSFVATVNHITNVTVSTSGLSHPHISDANGAASPVLIAIYRTAVNGSVFYRLTLEPSFSILINDTTVGDVTMLDFMPDSNISSGAPAVLLTTQPQPYTATGELPDVPPPASITGTQHGGRTVLVDSTGLTVWFSKDQSEDPGIAPGFNEALTLSFATPIVALASLDEKLVAYGENGIVVIHGDGPDATGAGAWQKQYLQSDVGCANPRSVAVCPLGSVFQSSRGIELLSRDLTASWIGKAVEDTLAAYPVITSAVLVAADHEVRFTCSTADGTSGIVLAWDYFHQAWMTRSYKDQSNTGAASVAFVDAALVGGVYTMITALGQVYVETDAHRLDGGVAFVSRDVILADMSPTSAMNWHRIKDVGLMGQSVTDHNLEVSVARDYAVAYEQTKLFTATTAPVAVGPLSKCRVTFKNQKCRAVRLRIRDLAPTAGVMGNGDGPIFEGLAFRFTTKDGLAKTAKSEQG